MNARSRITLRVMFGALLVAAIGQACSQYHDNDRYTVHTPGSTSFANVGRVLVRRCGTLDCHGSPNRNMRLYGEEGIRLFTGDPGAKPYNGDQPGSSETTNAELLEDFHSVVGVEPELFTQVVQEGGKNPERLTLVRKMRGTEAHLGGPLTVPGDDTDNCVLSWLASKTDDAACQNVLKTVDPLLNPPAP